MKRNLCLFWLVLVASFVFAACCRCEVVESPVITVLPDGRGFVEVETAVPVTVGTQQVKLEQFPDGVVPDSIRVVSKTKGVAVSAVVFRRGLAPRLNKGYAEVTIESVKKGTAKLSVSYQVKKLEWFAEYTMVLPDAGGEGNYRQDDARMWGDIVIKNQTGSAYRSARVYLVEGDRLINSADASASPATYGILESVDIPSGVVRIPFFSGKKIFPRINYVSILKVSDIFSSPGPVRMPVFSSLTIENEEGMGPGVDLPHGRISIFLKQGGSDAVLIGTSTILPAKRGESVSVYFSSPFSPFQVEVKGEEKKEVGLNTERGVVSVFIRNYGQFSFAFSLFLEFPQSDWKIVYAEPKWYRSDARHVLFPFTMPPGSTVEFTVDAVWSAGPEEVPDGQLLRRYLKGRGEK